MQQSGQQIIKRIQSLLFYLLLALAVGLGGWLSNRYSTTWDWSAGARNSLTETSQQVLERLEGPLHITSFTPEIPELREQIERIIARYQRYRPDLEFEFIDPNKRPELVRELGIRVTGELRLSYQGRSENLTTISEESISNAIQRLLQQPDRWVSVISGHGERRFDGRANHDLGGFSEELKRKGYQIQPLDLATTLDIPRNTALLVIADPRVALRPDELTRIQRYLDAGGNLLWLRDPGADRGLQALAGALGLSFLPGTIVDANASSLGLDNPAIALVPRYPPHPITRHFELVTLFPHAAALEAKSVGVWQATPLLSTLSRSWNETGPLQGEIKRNEEKGEQAGPLTIGLALTQNRDGREQRVLVIGDSDFLSNSFLGNGGNLDLGLNMFRWLTGDDRLLAIPARTAPDRTLELSETTTILISLLFLILLPLAFLASGLAVWWRRRKR
jgi:ABC-type uncharacterized transport system involved in gliding motility auxiliary subunit